MAFYGAELVKNGLALAPAAGGEDVEMLNNRGPVPFGTTTTRTVGANGNGNGAGNGNGNRLGTGDVGAKAPATLAEVSL